MFGLCVVVCEALYCCVILVDGGRLFWFLISYPHSCLLFQLMLRLLGESAYSTCSAASEEVEIVPSVVLHLVSLQMREQSYLQPEPLASSLASSSDVQRRAPTRLQMRRASITSTLPEQRPLRTAEPAQTAGDAGSVNQRSWAQDLEGKKVSPAFVSGTGV